MGHRRVAAVLAAFCFGAVRAADDEQAAAPLFENATFAFEEGEADLLGENVSLLGLERTSTSYLDINWEDCGSNGFWPALGKIEGFKPSRLQLGQKTTLKAWGSLSQPVQGGTVQRVIKAGFLRRSSESNLCEPDTGNLPLGAGTMTWRGMNCPIAAGSIDVLADLELAAYLPRAMLRSTVTITATSTAGVPIVCVKLQMAPARRLAAADAADQDSLEFLV